MANWSKTSTPASSVNSGNQFEPNDAIVAADINACFNNAFYSVDYATHMADAPDTSEAGNVATQQNPLSVSLVDNVVGGVTYKKFKFSNLKGATGAAGTSAGFGTPTYSTSTGAAGSNASVTVTADAQSPNTAKVFNFAFTIPRGATGSNGAVALTYSTIVSLGAIPVENATFTVEGAYFNRTPSVGEVVNIVGTKSSATYMIVGQVTAYTAPNATIKVLAASNIRGAQGAAGQDGSDGTAAIVNDSAYNKINFNLSGTTLSITVTAV